MQKLSLKFRSGVLASLGLTSFLSAQEPAPVASALPPVMPLCVPQAAPQFVPQTQERVLPRLLPFRLNRPPVEVQPNCPAPIVPLNPTTPETPPNTTPPAMNPDTQRQLDNAFAQANARGGAPSSAFNELMYGDLLGARSLRIGYRVPIVAQFVETGPAASGTLTGFTVNPNQGIDVTFGPTPNGTTRTIPSTQFPPNLSYFQARSGGGQIDTGFAQAVLQSYLSKSPLPPALQQQFNALSPTDRATILNNRGVLNTLVTNATKGLSFPQLTVSNVTAALGPGTIVYTAILNGETVVPLPGSSGAVGRTKMSEDNNPLPRDRIIFNYDYFNNVPLTPNGIDVNRFHAGFEKTFDEGRRSIEVRLPFASTLASSYTDGGQSRDVRLGNIRLALKRLWTNDEVLNVSSGLGVTLPTASDQTVYSQDGSTLYQFKNQSVTIEPFVAALYTPTERLYSQLWGSINFDTTGGKLTWNKDVFGGSGSSQFIDLPVMAIDYQIGYWLIRNDTARLRGLATFVELHYNQTLGQSTLVNAVNDNAAGMGFTVEGIGNKEMNLTAGVTTQIGDQLNVTLAASAPMFSVPNRTFDVQFGFRINYFFGNSIQSGAPNRMAINTGR